MRLLEKQTQQRFGAEEVEYGQDGGDKAAEHPADAAEFFGHLLVTGTQAASDQRHRGRLQAVPEGEGQAHDIHAHLMGCHGIGPLFGCHDGRHHKADPHQDLLEKNAVAYMDQIM